MLFVQITPQENGAHSNANRMTEFIPEGWAKVPDSMQIPYTFPFVILTVDKDTVVSMEPNKAAYEEAMKHKSEDPKTIEDLQQENKLLKAQIKAQTERSDFIEDCIAEMATQVYGGV